MSDFVMPSMGADMDSGTLVEWKVQPGDRVNKGDIIASVETSKAVMDVEVFQSGVVEALYVGEGVEVPVGEPLARIGDGSGNASASESGGRGETAPDSDEQKAPAPSKGEPEKGREQAREEPAQASGAETRTEVGERGTGSAARHKAARGEWVKASPAARRRAKELGVELSTLEGSGADGAIVAADVEQAARKTKGGVGAGAWHSSMRQAIAAAMTRSKREIPHYYLGTTIDLHAAESWLAQYNEGRAPDERILTGALLMKATAHALHRYPDLNGHYGEDGMTKADAVNPGMAIHLRGGGLVAPAILEADGLPLSELMTRLRDLVQRARRGGLRSSEMSQGTATITALGERGVDTVYGVIYPPQVAMVGFGRVRRRPVAVDDGLACHPAVDVTLAADHRVCDGHLGGLFLNEIDQLLQEPEVL